MLRILFATLLLTASPVNSTIFNPWRLPDYVFTQPNNNICNPLWTKEGSICNDVNLLQFGTVKNEELDNGLRRLNEEVNSISQKLSIAENRLNRAEDCGLEFYKRFSNNQLTQKLLKDAEICNNYLKPIRESALCFVCSKGNQNYFFKGKAIFGLDQCNSMLNSCGNFFRETFSIISGFIDFGNTLDNRVKQFAPSNWENIRVVGFFRRKLQEINQKVENANLINLMSSFSSNQIADPKVNSALCARLFNINKQPLISWLADCLSMVTHNIGDFVKVLNRVKREEQAIGAGQTTRLLQGLDFASDPNLFASDVTVLSPQDNMFTSYDGIQGSSLDSNSEGKQPFNATLASIF